MTEAATDNKRREHRHRVLKGATIVTQVNESEISCTIRNMNTGGAELKVAPDQFLPETFMLYVTVDRECYQCRLRWRRNERVGVAFTGTAIKPKWHYGS